MNAAMAFPAIPASSPTCSPAVWRTELVERFQAMADGDIRRWPGAEPAQGEALDGLAEGRPVPEVREAAPCARTQRVRVLRREETHRRPGQGRDAQGRRQAAQRPREGTRLRTEAPPLPSRRAPRRRAVPELREAAARARCQPLGTVFRGRTRPLREGQGGRQALRRARPRATPKAGAREEPTALARTPRRGPVHPLRAPAAGRGRHDLRAMSR